MSYAKSDLIYCRNFKIQKFYKVRPYIILQSCRFQISKISYQKDKNLIRKQVFFNLKAKKSRISPQNHYCTKNESISTNPFYLSVPKISLTYTVINLSRNNRDFIKPQPIKLPYLRHARAAKETIIICPTRVNEHCKRRYYYKEDEKKNYNIIIQPTQRYLM